MESMLANVMEIEKTEIKLRSTCMDKEKFLCVIFFRSFKVMVKPNTKLVYEISYLWDKGSINLTAKFTKAYILYSL